MQAFIEEAYQLFAPYTVRFPLNICTCECCTPKDCQRELLRYRLREIPANNLAGYLGSVPLADEAATARDMKHFLPRILQALVNDEDVRSLDEMLLDKLLCDLPECWPEDEIRWLYRFAAAWFAHQIAAPRYEGCLSAWLAMFHFAGLDVTDKLLALWTQSASETNALREFIGLYLTIPYGANEPDWYKACYLPDHRPHREYLVTKLSVWFADPHTRATFRRASEQALLAGREKPEETLLWEQCYNWLA
ncbi:hypothetical protein [Eikenella sp. NML01-A-086]|uniref:hypothetical protein n=1 Tax=Eikenella sp. NML01-A-086 TaxID=1795826 RepID=UPI0007E1556A|nr:hypothetical protein [Eikenella sp. NML01-A-086]OAM28746.1 hypothetical protein A7P94_01645 [Eikenella sp. NML01-A-086]